MLVLRAAKVRKSFISRCVAFSPDLFLVILPVNCDQQQQQRQQQGKHQKSLQRR